MSDLIARGLDNKAFLKIAEKDEQIKNIHSPHKYRGAIVTFVDDDATTRFTTNLYPTFEEKNVKCNISAITSKIDTYGYLTKSELLNLQNQGYEIVSHTHTHSKDYFETNLDTTSDSILESEFSLSQKYLKDNGFLGYDTVTLVYSQSARVKRIASKYYTNGIGLGGGINPSPIDNMCIYRIWLNTAVPITTIQGYVDDALANNKWIVFGTHSYDTSIINGEYLGQVIDYIKSKNIPIMTLREAIKFKGNVVSAGEFTETGFFVGIDGSTKGLFGLNMIEVAYSGTIDDSPFLFPKYKITSFQVSSSQDTYFNSGGVMHIYHGSTYYSYEVFHCNNKTMYYRTYNDSSLVWNAFVSMSPALVKSSTTGEMDFPITSYDLNKETIVKFSSSKDTFLGVGGTMRIFRGDTYYSYALYYPLNTTDCYLRLWDNYTGGWGLFKRIGTPRSGSTTNRLAVKTTTLSIGESYFDTSLNKPLWVKSISPTVWVDSTGTVVS